MPCRSAEDYAARWALPPVGGESRVLDARPMPRILIVFASTHGHTAKVARRIAEVVREAGVDADVRDVRSAGSCDLGGYDGAVVGGSVHMGAHQLELVEWAGRHARQLNALPSAFFSVCLAVADDTDESRAHARDWIDDFEDDTGWTPRPSASFAGALQYCEYDVMTRLLMRLMMARGHHPTDVSTDVEYTDWNAVDGFALEMAARVASPGDRRPAPMTPTVEPQRDDGAVPAAATSSTSSPRATTQAAAARRSAAATSG